MTIPDDIFQASVRQLLGPASVLLDRDDVSEIMINGPDRVFIESRGRVERTRVRFEDAEAVLALVRNVAQYSGRHVDEREPVLEARLPDGSRFQAVLAPLAQGGPYVCIRRFLQEQLTRPMLIASGTLTEHAADALAALVVGKANIVISGGTGTGKTSLLNWLGAHVPADERIGVIEDAREICLPHDHVFSLQARPANEDGEGEVRIRDLFRASLRMRPDRVVVGETRGAEALDLVQAMVSGHDGCLSTLHASHPRDALTRLETMALMSDVDLPLAALRRQIASGLDIIVHLARLRSGQRVITHISEVLGYDAREGYQTRDLFHRSDFEAGSALRYTGAVPAFSERLRAHGGPWPKLESGAQDA